MCPGWLEGGSRGGTIFPSCHISTTLLGTYCSQYSIKNPLYPINPLKQNHALLILYMDYFLGNFRSSTWLLNFPLHEIIPMWDFHSIDPWADSVNKLQCPTVCVFVNRMDWMVEYVIPKIAKLRHFLFC